MGVCVRRLIPVTQDRRCLLLLSRMHVSCLFVYCAVVLFCVSQCLWLRLSAGMTGSEVLQRVEQGYRMPRPAIDRFMCTEVLYDMMCKCWDRNPDSRPTFAFLYSFFDDYFVSAEPHYKENFWMHWMTSELHTRAKRPLLPRNEVLQLSCVVQNGVWQTKALNGQKDANLHQAIAKKWKLQTEFCAPFVTWITKLELLGSSYSLDVKGIFSHFSGYHIVPCKKKIFQNFPVRVGWCVRYRAVWVKRFLTVLICQRGFPCIVLYHSVVRCSTNCSELFFCVAIIFRSVFLKWLKRISCTAVL